jgi:hypothetical protein
MKSFKILSISSFVLLISGILLSYSVTKKLNSYKSDKESIAEVLNFEERILNGSEIISFFGSADEKIDDWNELRKSAEAKYWSAYGYGAGLLLLVLAYMSLNYFVYDSSPDKDRVLGIVFVFSALSFLYVGVQAPIIEVEAFSEDLSIGTSFLSKSFEGRTYYLYQNKSIFGVIKLLFLGGNILVGFCVLVLSLIFPLVKLLSSLYVFIKPNTSFAHKSVKIINALGKWSMADVFIVAVFLAVFSFANMNIGLDTASKTLIGLYLFFIFVILSIVSGRFLKLVVKSA